MASTLLAVLAAGVTPILVIALVIFGTGLSPLQWQPPILWKRQFGTPNADNSVTVLSGGASALYAGGYVGGPEWPGSHPSASYLFISRYDLNGYLVWSQHFGNPHTSEIRALAVGTDAVFVAGNLNGTSFLRKYDLKGAEVWNSQYGSDLGNDAKTLSAGSSGVYVSGYGFWNATSGTRPVVIQKYDLDGTPAWTSILGNEGSSGSHPVLDVTSTGVYIASEVSSSDSSHVIVAKYDFNGVSNWTRQLDDSYGFNWRPSGITSDSSGVYVVAEYFIGYNGEALLRKYDSGGNQLWTLQLTPPDYSGIGSVAISASTSGVYLGYATFVEHDFLAKYDGSGNQEWSFQMRGSPRSIFAGANGVYVGGGGAYLAEFSQSSSLILFGVNPPFSFGLVALLGGIVAAAVMLMRRRWKRKYRPRSANMLRFKDIRRDTSSHTRSNFRAEPVLHAPP